MSTYISSDHYEGLSDILSSWDLNEFSNISSILNPNKKISAYYQTMVTTDIDVPVSVVTSVEQCLVDKDLQNQMKHSPFYSIYVKSNKY